MVIYGRVGSDKDGTSRSSKCIHGGAAFVWPVIQAYAYMDLTPISISVDLRNALSRQNIRIDVPSRFTVGISTETGIMMNAAERLLGLKLAEIQELAKDIIFGQLRLVIATMNIEEINTDRDKFLDAISRNVEGELKKIGLRLINVNVTDISDESGYIIALGKEAAAKAINDAKISVAEADRTGSIGEAQAKRDQRINVALADSEAIKGENEANAQIATAKAVLREKEAEALRRAVTAEKVQSAQAASDSQIAIANAQKLGNIGEAEAQRDQRIAMSQAEATAISGENEAKANIAAAQALLREKEAEAQKKAVSAEKIQAAMALKEAYDAEQKAEIARAALEKATQEADIIVKMEIEKRRKELEAEAEAEQMRRRARGDADAIYAKMEAEARGVKEMLTKQADGIQSIVNAAGGNANDAMKLMIADKIENLVSTQVEAIKNLKIDKITVWDSGDGKGNSSTSNFLSGLLKSLPPMSEIFNMAGLNLPEILQPKQIDSKTAEIKPVEEAKPAKSAGKSDKGDK
jgi:flotillin